MQRILLEKSRYGDEGGDGIGAVLAARYEQQRAYQAALARSAPHGATLNNNAQALRNTVGPQAVSTAYAQMLAQQANSTNPPEEIEETPPKKPNKIKEDEFVL